MVKSMLYRSLWLLLLLPLLAMGAEVKGLYEAEMFVGSQTRGERTLAMTAALAEGFTKVSGRRDARLRPSLAKALRSPGSYLQQYHYRPLPAGTPTDTTAGDDPQLLVLRFDKPAVDKLLREAGLPVWGATRPSVLAWLAVEDDGQRYLLSADSPEPLRRLLEDSAQRRGLALLLPLQDLEDQMALGFADVWGEFRDPILRASQRYRPEVVLAGRAYRNGDEWRADWTVMEGQEQLRWQSDGVLPAEVLEDGVMGAMEWLAARYVPLEGAGDEGLLRVTVSGVHSLADYVRVTRYLSSVQQIRRVHTRQVDADQVGFELEVQGRPEGVAQIIALGNVLVRDALAPVTPPAGGQAAQVYQLRP